MRRLNNNIFSGSKTSGIELERFKLLPALKRVLKEFDSPFLADNYWIGLSYSRPLGNISKIESAARTELRKFLMIKQQTPHEIRLSPHVSITIIKANRKSTHVFEIGIESDHDSGGFVAQMYIENINHCIAEKTQKIQQYKDKYPEWWLVLLDFLVGGVAEPEKTIIIQQISKSSYWKKIIVIHPVTLKEILKIG